MRVVRSNVRDNYFSDREYGRVYNNDSIEICQIHDWVRGYVLLDSWQFPYKEFRGGTDQSRWTYYPTFGAAYEALVTKLVAEKLETA